MGKSSPLVGVTIDEGTAPPRRPSSGHVEPVSDCSSPIFGSSGFIDAVTAFMESDESALIGRQATGNQDQPVVDPDVLSRRGWLVLGERLEQAHLPFAALRRVPVSAIDAGGVGVELPVPTAPRAMLLEGSSNLAIPASPLEQVFENTAVKLYPRLALFEALAQFKSRQERRNPSGDDIVEARRNFLDSFAYLCDVQKGGATVTAAGLQKLTHGNFLWLAANEGVRNDIKTYAEAILFHLKLSEPPPSMTHAKVIDYCYDMRGDEVGEIKKRSKDAKDDFGKLAHYIGRLGATRSAAQYVVKGRMKVPALSQISFIRIVDAPVIRKVTLDQGDLSPYEINE
ncbi:hypothetical protein CORC01_11802 [Colletotrichum orchidophilum]|uniref:Uncharacterized protein n=1 Tax=Colletotrichum orchidophilum TaxID=1209926 RepID=A0A1G4AV03_9PEZI|nr:uncharacterized protein CORC01_11802 [Colletotrichum orchidophilum]OHE92935.1 hypothetical protein CORC01_11802 [Colletotrichum orchidophilum]